MGVDLTEYSAIVIDHALDQAARHHAPELHFVHVKERRQRSIEELKQRLSSAVYPSLEIFNEHGVDWRARLHVRSGKPDQQIASLAADVLADLIVIGQFGLHRGAVPGRLLHQAPCATLVVGMPPAHDTSQCDACGHIREHTEGDRWFCDEHTGERKTEHAMTPMTSWTGGTAVS